MNKQELSAAIWSSCNKMRGKMDASEYKDFILGFIFYKYLSSKIINFWTKENEVPYEELQTVIGRESSEFEDNKEYTMNTIGYFIAYEDLFQTWIEKGKSFEYKDANDALNIFDLNIAPNSRETFEGIFNELSSKLSKIGSNEGEKNKNLKDLIYVVNKVPTNGAQDYDVLGYVYEYLISMFASTAGKKGGEFYTPNEVSILMSDIVAYELQERDDIKIYDPTSGSASLLINIGKSIKQHGRKDSNIQYYAQELNETTFNLTRMNLVMRGIAAGNIHTRNADTLKEDWPLDKSQEHIKPVKFDAVVSNPPYSQKWEPEIDDRFNGYGLAPKGKADYAFLLHDLYHIGDDGVVTIVLPHGVLFRGGEEGVIRKQLLENHNIDTIIGLPANIFFGTGIPTIIIVLKKHRSDDDVLFIDASKGFAKEGKQNVLRAMDIKRIFDTYVNRETNEKYSRTVSLEEIRENDYNLNIPRYVDSSEKAESYDIYSLMHGGVPHEELSLLSSYFEIAPSLKDELFELSDHDNYSFKDIDISETVFANEEVKKYISSFNEVTSNFDSYLEDKYILNSDNLDINKTRETVSAELFNTLKNFPLIDVYKAYEVLNEQLLIVEKDYESISRLGKVQACQTIDETVEQSGKKKTVTRKGLVIPLDIIQKTYFKEEYDKYLANSDRLSEISSSCSEIIESLTEEEKEDEDLEKCLNNNKDAFKKSDLKSYIKEQKKYDPSYVETLEDEDSLLYRCNHYLELLDEETKVKKDNKNIEADITEKAFAQYSKLSEEEINALLFVKWIEPLLKEINEMPIQVIDEFISNLTNIKNKYSETLKDINEQIEETEKELCSMLSELTGSEKDMEGIQTMISLLSGGSGNGK